MKVKFDMIGLFVKDLQAMVSFYRDVIGIDIDWNGEGPYAEFKHNGIRFAFFERKMLPDLLGQEPTYPDGLNGTFELAINYPLLDDVDREFTRIVNAGGRPVYEPRNEPWGLRSSMIADPENNLIELGSWIEGQK